MQWNRRGLRLLQNGRPRERLNSSRRVLSAGWGVLLWLLVVPAGGVPALRSADDATPPPPSPPPPLIIDDLLPEPPPAPPAPGDQTPPAGASPPAPVSALGTFQLQPFGRFYLLDDGAIAVVSNERERAGFRSAQFELSCDGAVYNPKKGYLYAEGHVTVVEGLTRVSCQRFFYDLAQARGWAEQVEVVGLERLSPSLIKGPGNSAEPPAPYLSALPAPDAQPGSSLDNLPDAALLPPRADPPEGARLLMLRAEKLWRLDTTHYAADQARVTSSEMPAPEWSLDLNHVTYTHYAPGDDGRARGRVNGDNATVRIFGLPLFWSPWAAYPVGLKGPFLAGEIGQSRRWGTFGDLRVGFDASDIRRDHPDAALLFLLPRRSYVDFTPRSDRGIGGGLTFRWEGLRAHPYDRLSFHIDGIDEQWISRQEDSERAQRFVDLRTLNRAPSALRRALDPTLLFAQRLALQGAVTIDPQLELYRGETRTNSFGDLHLEREPVSGLRAVADLSFADIHDPQYLEEYNPNQFRIFRSERGESYDPSRWQTSPRAVNQAVLKGFWQEFVLEGRWEQPAERFQTAAPSFDPFGFHQPAYEPEARLFLLPLPVWGGFVVEGEGVAGRLEERFDPILLGATAYQADRYGGRVLVSRPWMLGGFSLRPRVGVQATHYSRYDLGPQTDVDQAALLTGVELVDRWSGRSDVAFTALGLDGFDHIVEFFADYDFTGRPAELPGTVPGFDRWDDLAELQVIRFGIRQSFLNVNPRGRADFARRYARLELSTEAFPDPADASRLLYRGSFDSLVGSFQWRPRSFFQLDGWARYWLNDGFLERSSLALAYLPLQDFRCSVRELHTGRDPARGMERQDTLHLDLEWDISRRWRAGYGVTWELYDTALVRKGVRYQRITLTRDFGSMEVGGYVAVDPDRNETLGLVSLKVKPSRAQAWPVRDNRRVVKEILDRDEAAREKEAAAQAAAEKENDHLRGGELGWMERVAPPAEPEPDGSPQR